MDFRQKHNMAYYNQMLRADKKKGNHKHNNQKNVSFTKQDVNLKDYLYVPEGWETFIYTIYFLLIPYIFGSIFLFITVANSNFDSYKLMDTSSFFIVWAIGYEITATIALIGILVMYLQYDEDD